ncbi:hypothetical protein M885DRAFT_501215 [Pelagophyceae sp. CCMP2097]|nr:hypothetical protein M885DRAFT_501215 [Pelagophyceae sp. CCMP2097]
MASPTRALGLALLVAAAYGKDLVETAHPHLKAMFAKNGELTMADFVAAAAQLPVETNQGGQRHAAKQDGSARLGAIEPGPDDCAPFLSPRELCYSGDYNGDDDFLAFSPILPSACSTCGFYPPAKQAAAFANKLNFADCVTCEADAELIVLYSDCTGLCASTTPNEDKAVFVGGIRADTTFGFLQLLGLGSRDESACTAFQSCYAGADLDALLALPLQGTNFVFAFENDDGGSSYSYSYSRDKNCSDSTTWHKRNDPSKDCA